MPDNVLYPVALRSEELVWASDLAAAGDRPSEIICIGCGALLVLRAGTQKRPHFAHRAGVTCTGGESALHRTAVRIIAASIRARSARGDEYPITWTCVTCGHGNSANLSRHPAASVMIDSAIAEDCAIRPDIAVRTGDHLRYVVEVVVTHEPEVAALDAYRERAAPVVIVRPNWDALERLRATLVSTDVSASIEVLGAPCAGLRHPPKVEPVCTCGEHARLFALEIVRGALRCYSCRHDVPVLDVIAHDSNPPCVLAASSVNASGIDEFARDLPVRLRFAPSKAMERTYLMHHCVNCGAKAGDNFVYEEADGGSLQPGSAVVYATRCDAGHWREVERRVVREETFRFEGTAAGMWGMAEVDQSAGYRSMIRSTLGLSY